MELERIYVLSPYQGQGVGAKALNFVLQLAKRTNKTYVWLGVWEKNEAAIRFYEKWGFKKIGTHPYDIGNDRQTD